MELDNHPDTIQEPSNCLSASSDSCCLLSNSPSQLISSQGRTGKLFSSIRNNDFTTLSTFVPKVNTQSGDIILKIEDILQQMVDCIIDGKKELVLHLKSRMKPGNEVLDAATGAIKCSTRIGMRTIRFPGKTAQEAWKFTALLRILELCHEAVVSGVVTTKRDIYYRDPELFFKQQVVDRYVDDIAFNLGVKREALNVVAAAKGLLAGHLTIVKRDKTVVDCRVGNEGVLLPSMEEIDHLDIKGARWALVIEKEATFRSLVASQYWGTSPAGKGILVTGKGYPDIQTRAFIRLLSTRRRRENGQLDSSYLQVFALMDFDPDGIAILSTYKHGSVSLAHENDTLVAPRMKWLGIKSDVIKDIHRDKVQSWPRLTLHDRRKAGRMLEKPICQEEVEPSWRRELQIMLMLNIKAEIQILGACSNLEDYLSSALKSNIYSTMA